MHIALYQPDIPQNLGSILRLCACLEVTCHIIEPCGFVLDDKRLRRVAMDYAQRVTLVRHMSWEAFLADTRGAQARLLLLSTKAAVPYHEYTYRETDRLLLGRESAGVPQAVADVADARLVIAMATGARSLNLVQAASMVLGEALRQTRWS